MNEANTSASQCAHVNSKNGVSTGGWLRWMGMTVFVGAVLMGSSRRASAATVVVSNTTDVVNGDTSSITALQGTDGGDGISLREAVIACNNDGGNNTIDLTGVTGTISLSPLYGPLSLNYYTTISGPGAANLSISGGGATQVFTLPKYYNNTTYQYNPRDVSISGLTITGGSSNRNGGNIQAYYRRLTLSDCTISNGYTSDTGGGIFVRGNPYGQLVLNHCTVSGNYAGYEAGGIGLRDPDSAYIDSSTISNNTSRRGGGGLYAVGRATINVRNSTFSGNSCYLYGNGSAISAANLYMGQCTISGNSSYNGGALALRNADIYNSTITGNQGVLGAGVTVFSNGPALQAGLSARRSYGNVRISSTIISGNSTAAGKNSDLAIFGSPYYHQVNVTNSLITTIDSASQPINGTNTANIFNQPAKLTPLGDYGGPTQTHLLQFNSPGIDAGLPGSSFYDQRGLPFLRTIGAATDMGATEGFSQAPFVDAVNAPAVTAASMPNPYDFTITFADSTGIDVSTLGSGNVLVTGPNGFNQPATFISVDVNSNGQVRVATYRITPPGGTWDAGDNGEYAITTQPNQVKDIDGNAVAASQVGSIRVAIVQTFVVKNLNDSGADSLRDCLIRANNDSNSSVQDVITFQAGLTGTITLSQPLYVEESVNIQGPGASVVTVSGNNSYQIMDLYGFQRPGGMDVAISGLTLSNGYSGAGAAIGNIAPKTRRVDGGGSLSLADSVFSGNYSTGSRRGSGGAVTFVSFYGASFSVKNCTFSGNYGDQAAAITSVVYVDGAIDISNATFTNNSSNTAGALEAGIYLNGTLNIAGCSLTGNTSYYSSGAASIFSGYQGVSAVVDGCTFANNSAMGTRGSQGGGALIARSTNLTISNSTFQNNAAIENGGAIQVYGGRRYGGGTTIDNCTITGNSAYSGGGIAAAYCDITIKNSVISGNQASYSGGGVQDDACNLTMQSTTVDSNTVTGRFGGGLYSEGNGYLLVDGCTFSNNSSLYAGGISIYNKYNAVIQNSTISGNSATKKGGGLYAGLNKSTPPATYVTVRNSTITNNTSDKDDAGGEKGGGVYIFGGPTVLSSNIISGNKRGTAAPVSDDVSDASSYIDPVSDHNLIGDGTGLTTITNGANGNQVGTAAAPIDPLIGALADNGGPTKTHLLQSGSPAIDNGSNLGSLTVEQRGFARVIGASVDIGSVDFDAVAPTAAIGSAPNVDASSNPTDYTFTVVFSDNQAIDVKTLDNNDILVTGPNGFSQLAQFVSVDVNTAGPTRTATYHFTPPGGSWDAADNGVYQFSVVDGQVKDVQGNGVVGGTIGSMTVASTNGGALDPNGDIDGDGFTNLWEQILGSDPRNPNSRPFNLGVPTTGGLMRVARLMVDLDFTTNGKDLILIKGTLPVKNTSFGLAGQVVILDVGGVVKAFTLDASGKATNGGDSIAVRLGKKRGATFTATFKNGTFASTFTDEGLTANKSDKGQKLVKAVILLNSLYYQAIVKKPYDPVKGKFGR